MFAAEKDGQYEPYKVRPKRKSAATHVDASADGGAIGTSTSAPVTDTEEFEEDLTSEVDAIWPIQRGQIVDWPCFYALMTHVYNTINPPFHTPILLIGEPVWTLREHEKITQFFFEKFKIPAFVIVDAAMATSYAYRAATATIVDVGLDKANVTAILDHLMHSTGRTLALPDAGGVSMTQTLSGLLSGQGFTPAMCEQLKKSNVCEVLKPEDMPGADVVNPAAAASTGANGLGEESSKGDESTSTEPKESAEGVLDIASLVTSGNMTEYLERKEREKADKATAKAQKKTGDAAANAPKVVKLPNSKKHKNTFLYQDVALENALKDMNVDGRGMADMQNAMNAGSDDADATSGKMTREIEVGPERFQAASGGILERLADAVYRTISSVEEVHRRNELWSSLVIVGNGSKVRGFKEALVATLQAKYLISPSSATMFTSEIPSNISTPLGTGMNTPQPQAMGVMGGSSQVNPLLLAATTAQNPYAAPQVSGVHASHSQSPTSIDLAKVPEHFPEWKEAGYEEAVFLGAQVAVKVIFSGDTTSGKGYMTRTDYNEQGPQAIHEYSI